MKAVVTLGKYFGPKHPRKGQETGFIAKVADGRKVHTCRSNYGYWRAKIEKITATGGVLRVRQWSAKPYRSPQEVITEIPAGIVGVQRLALRRERRVINHYAEEQDKPIATATYYDYTAEVDGHPVPLEILAENDGLTVDDLLRYYSLYKKAVLMGTRSDNLPNGLYRDDDGSIGLIICPKCQRENYALNVALGYCTWCGYDANKDYNIHKDKDDESKGHN